MRKRYISFVSLLILTACTSVFTPVNTPTLSTLVPTFTPVLAVELALADKTIILREVQSQRTVRVLLKPPLNAQALQQSVFSPNQQALLVSYQILTGESNNVAFANYFVNASTQQVTQLEPQQILKSAFSPDGQWLAYIAYDQSIVSIDLPSLHISSSLARPNFGGGQSLPKNLFVLSVSQPAPQVTAPCNNEVSVDFSLVNCSDEGLFWTFDSQSVIWTDNAGIWRYFVDDQSKKLILAHQRGAGKIPPKNHKSGLASLGGPVIFYYPQSASPYGYHLWLKIGHYEGSSQGLLDLETGKVGNLDGTFMYTGPGFEAKMRWLPDEKIEITRYAFSPEIWDVTPTGQLEFKNKTTPEVILAGAAEQLHIYIEQGQVKQIHNDGTTKLLVKLPENDATTGDYTISANGEYMLLAYNSLINYSFYISLFDAAKNQVTRLYQTSGQLHNLFWNTPSDFNFYDALAFSPDGQWLSYIAYNAPWPQATQLQPHLLIGGGGGDPGIQGMVMIAPLSAPTQARPFAGCGQEFDSSKDKVPCLGRLFWTSDSQTLMWQDGLGLRTKALSLPLETAPQLFSLASPLRDFSPSGLYARFGADYQPQFLMNTKTGQQIPLPEFIDYDAEVDAPQITWQQDDMLYIQRFPPKLEIWRIDPATENVLVHADE